VLDAEVESVRFLCSTCHRRNHLQDLQFALGETTNCALLSDSLLFDSIEDGFPRPRLCGRLAEFRSIAF